MAANETAGAVRAIRWVASGSGIALAWLCGSVGGCSADPSEVVGGPTSAASTTGNPTTSSTTSDSSSGRTPSTSSEGGATETSSGPALDDTTSESSSGPSDSSSGSEGGSSESSESTGGGVSPFGCADEERDILTDLVAYPNIAACDGGFGQPGVGADTPQCNRDGGDDGPFPDGMPCSIDDLCAEGWHVCRDRADVTASGLASCGGIAWEGRFFATAQSGEGSDTCGPTGGNDVFGCGEIGLAKINGCAPLNRSTGNLCVNVGGPWSCDGDAYNEVATIVKTGPSHGGALCCRDL